MEQNNFKMSEDDQYLFNLLNIQEAAVQLALFSDLLSYEIVQEGKEIIINRYMDTGVKIDPWIPDLVNLQSLYIYGIAKVMFYYISVSRYEYLYNKKQKGEWEYSLEPNIYVNIYNLLGLFGLCLAIDASIEFFNRDTATPVFGVW